MANLDLELDALFEKYLTPEQREMFKQLQQLTELTRLVESMKLPKCEPYIHIYVTA